MGKARELPVGKIVTKVTVELTAGEVETLIYIASRYPADMGDKDNLAPALRRCIDGFGGRKAATDQHGGKVRKAAAAKRDGSISKAGVKFKRYQPLFPQRPLDEIGTPAAVGKWVRSAPILTWDKSTKSYKAAG